MRQGGAVVSLGFHQTGSWPWGARKWEFGGRGEKRGRTKNLPSLFPLLAQLRKLTTERDPPCLPSQRADTAGWPKTKGCRGLGCSAECLSFPPSEVAVEKAFGGRDTGTHTHAHLTRFKGCCAVLYCTVLVCCAVLCCAVLCCFCALLCLAVLSTPVLVLSYA